MLPSEIERMTDELSESCSVVDRPVIPSVDIIIIARDVIYTSFQQESVHPALGRFDLQEMKDYLDQLISQNPSINLTAQVDGNPTSCFITLMHNTRNLCFDFLDYAISTIP